MAARPEKAPRRLRNAWNVPIIRSIDWTRSSRSRFPFPPVPAWVARPYCSLWPTTATGALAVMASRGEAALRRRTRRGSIPFGQGHAPRSIATLPPFNAIKIDPRPAALRWAGLDLAGQPALLRFRLERRRSGGWCACKTNLLVACPSHTSRLVLRRSISCQKPMPKGFTSAPAHVDNGCFSTLNRNLTVPHPICPTPRQRPTG